MFTKIYHHKLELYGWLRDEIILYDKLICDSKIHMTWVREPAYFDMLLRTVTVGSIFVDIDEVNLS